MEENSNLTPIVLKISTISFIFFSGIFSFFHFSPAGANKNMSFIITALFILSGIFLFMSTFFTLADMSDDLDKLVNKKDRE